MSTSVFRHLLTFRTKIDRCHTYWDQDLEINTWKLFMIDPMMTNHQMRFWWVAPPISYFLLGRQPKKKKRNFGGVTDQKLLVVQIILGGCHLIILHHWIHHEKSPNINFSFSKCKYQWSIFFVQDVGWWTSSLSWRCQLPPLSWRREGGWVGGWGGTRLAISWWCHRGGAAARGELKWWRLIMVEERVIFYGSKFRYGIFTTTPPPHTHTHTAISITYTFSQFRVRIEIFENHPKMTSKLLQTTIYDVWTSFSSIFIHFWRFSDFFCIFTVKSWKTLC